MIRVDLGFVFVHVNKTAGTSVEAALAPIAPRAGARKHQTALWAREHLGPDEFARCFRFATVRNPWDRAVSLYRARQQRRERFGRPPLPPFTHWLGALEEAAHDLSRFTPKQRLYTFAGQAPWLTDGTFDPEADEHSPGDPAAPLLVDHLLRFERIAADWRPIAERLGLPPDLPHLNRSKRGHYSEYYTPEDRDRVARLWPHDVERFHYEF